MKRVYPGEFEELVLLVVAMLENDAYGVKITHEIIQQTNRSVRLNQVHASLHRLEEKGLIVSKIGDAQPGTVSKITYTTMPFYQASSPLLPSGLMGPVRLLRR